MQTLIHGNKLAAGSILAIAVAISVLSGSWKAKKTAALKRWCKECELYKKKLESENDNVVLKFTGAFESDSEKQSGESL